MIIIYDVMEITHNLEIESIAQQFCIARQMPRPIDIVVTADVTSKNLSKNV